MTRAQLAKIYAPHLEKHELSKIVNWWQDWDINLSVRSEKSRRRSIRRKQIKWAAKNAHRLCAGFDPNEQALWG